MISNGNSCRLLLSESPSCRVSPHSVERLCATDPRKLEIQSPCSFVLLFFYCHFASWAAVLPLGVFVPILASIRISSLLCSLRVLFFFSFSLLRHLLILSPDWCLCGGEQLWEESQLENERLRDRLRGTHEELTKCKDQLDNAFQVVRPLPHPPPPLSASFHRPAVCQSDQPFDGFLPSFTGFHWIRSQSRQVPPSIWLGFLTAVT